MFDHLRPPTTTHQKGSTFHACKIPHLVITSNVIGVVYCIKIKSRSISNPGFKANNYLLK
jgi:hypothetical protein